MSLRTFQTQAFTIIRTWEKMKIAKEKKQDPLQSRLQWNTL